ncbi:MAG TPA: lectin-like protein [Polyangiaceae bacterium]|nr:lectin-like protein [Polyangiaceae bacterium]
MSVIIGPRDAASTLSGSPRRRRELVVLSLLSCWGCTFTSDEFSPSPVVVTEAERPSGAGASALPELPAASTEGPAPAFDPGEVEPPVHLVPGLDEENAGGTRTGDEGAEPLDAGVDATAAGDAGRDAAAIPIDASTNARDASAPPNARDAGTPPSEPDASASPNTPCPGLVFESSCYEFFAEQLSWDVAEERCVAWGGHLASVESLEEDAFLGAWPALIGIAFSDGSGLWLGGTDARTDGDFRWSDGRALSYEGWASDQPNNGPGVDCIEKRNDVTQRWYDRRCTDGERYVCERPQ